jgi:hypothetical protein
MTIDWDNIIEIIKSELIRYHNQGYKPTLRSIFYLLYSKKSISNTNSTYKSLVRATVKARQDGRLPIDCFADNSRNGVGNFNEIFVDPIDYIGRTLSVIKNIPEAYQNFIPRWHKQLEYVEVWSEKDAMSDIFQSILKGKDVRIIPHKGFTSLTFLYECVKRLKQQKNKGKNIHVLYYGDFDPSGDYMVNDLLKRMKRLGLTPYEIDFQTIAVTQQQIKKYNLPFNPDKMTIEKMNRDSRTTGFVAKYGHLFSVEIDALPALIPDIFKDKVIQSVEQYFDRDIYAEVLSNISPNDINRLLKERIIRLTTKL